MSKETGFPQDRLYSNPRHLDEFVKKHPVRRIFPNLETELYDMLVKCAPLFENFEE